jgi:hypothetical protein
LEQSDKEAFYYFQLAADKGYPYAFREIAKCYHCGKGIGRSYHEAANYYRLGVEGKDAESQYALGVYFKYGRGGLEQSDQQAFYYFRLAADQGYPSAFRELAECYYFGRGAEQSHQEAKSLYQHA